MTFKPRDIQESQYVFPYHWSLTPDSYGGRVYWGYLNTIIQILGDTTNKKILDAGCGDGRLSAELSKKGAVVTGVDYSGRAINFSKLFAPNINFIQADIKSLPFEDEKFDNILLVETLEHVSPQNIATVLSELKRVLKNDGKLIISTPSLLLRKSPKHYQHFSEQSLKEALSDYFLIEKIIGSDKKSFFWRNVYRLIDNRFFEIKALRKYFNLNIYPKYLRDASICNAQRLIAQCKKK